MASIDTAREEQLEIREWLEMEKAERQLAFEIWLRVWQNQEMAEVIVYEFLVWTLVRKFKIAEYPGVHDEFGCELPPHHPG